MRILQNLDSLNLSGSRVTNLSPLSEFKNLRMLNLANTQVHGKLWLASIPVKRMPAGLPIGDNVAL